MPSTQSPLSVEKGNDAGLGPVNQQPPPAPVMSTDPNAPGQRAMRFRGGCVVRHPSAVPIPITHMVFRDAQFPVGAAIYRAAFEEESVDAPAMRLTGVFLASVCNFSYLYVI